MVEKSLVIGSENHLLSIEGESTSEPTYGIPAKWVGEEQIAQANKLSLTIVKPELVLYTHVSEVLSNNLHDVISRTDIDKMLLQVKKHNPNLVEEVIPQRLAVSELLKLLRLLLKEKVNIRYLEMILETATEGTDVDNKNIENLVERVRERLSIRICENYLDQNEELNVMAMDASLEVMFRQLLLGKHNEGEAADPSSLDKFIKKLMRYSDEFISKGHHPILLCPSNLRAPIRKITERVLPRLAVVSAQEVTGVKQVNTIAKIAV